MMQQGGKILKLTIKIIMGK